VATKTLQEELQRREPFESLEQEATLSLLRTSDLLDNRIARFLRQHDLTPSQYNVLRILGREGRPMPCLDVAKRMVQVAAPITRVVDQLLAQGLVSKTQAREDHRVFLIGLTTRARSLLRKLDQPVLQLHASLLGKVDPADLQELIRILREVRQQMIVSGATRADAQL